MPTGYHLAPLDPPLQPTTAAFVRDWTRASIPASLTGPSTLDPTDVIASADPQVVATAQRLTVGLSDAPSRAVALFRFVRDTIRYDIGPDLPSRSAWHAAATLARGRGFCQQKAVLLAALLRAAGIPSALGFQHVRDWKLQGTRFAAILPEGVIIYHGLTFAWLHGAWRAMDATLDAGLCERRNYQLVSADPTGDAYLPRKDLAGNRHFDLFAQFGPSADLPTSVSDLFVSVQETWSEARTLARQGATM